MKIIHVRGVCGNNNKFPCSGFEEDYKNKPVDMNKLRSMDALRRTSMEPRSPGTSPTAAYAETPGQRFGCWEYPGFQITLIGSRSYVANVASPAGLYFNEIDKHSCRSHVGVLRQSQSLASSTVPSPHLEIICKFHHYLKVRIGSFETFNTIQ